MEQCISYTHFRLQRGKRRTRNKRICNSTSILKMTFYDLMAPLETAVEDARKLPKRPVLGITTPEATPTNAHGSRFEWNGWEEGADHIQSCVKKHSSRKPYPPILLSTMCSSLLSGYPPFIRHLLTTYRHQAGLTTVSTFSGPSISRSRRSLSFTQMSEMWLNRETARNGPCIYLWAYMS